jgi:hypothetical protein
MAEYGQYLPISDASAMSALARYRKWTADIYGAGVDDDRCRVN